MSDTSIKKNGFTVIELLIVIIVLATLLLIALPTVRHFMKKTSIDNFYKETKELLKKSETVFSDACNNGSITTKESTREIKEITIDGESYEYLCIELEDLKASEYTSTNYSKKGYTGVIEVFKPSNGDTIYGINISNGTYAYQKMTLDKLKDDEEPEQLAKVSNSCPDNDGDGYIHKPSEYTN